jgi:hypothetical protein
MDAIMLSWEMNRDAMWYSGVKNPVSFDHAANIAYMAMASDATAPALAPVMTT